MKPLAKSEIIEGLHGLGLSTGDKVLVHSSLAAIGSVEGGVDTVIDALLEVIGPDGLLVMPTFSCASPFDRKTSTSGLGKIPDTFWRRPGVVRSLHPSHSVAAFGKGAEELIRDHEKAPTAYAEGTPYVKLADLGGKTLMIGVDQDRNTTLHGGEAMAGVPYLVDTERTYVDDDGRLVNLPIKAMAGPHRDFIGLDSLFCSSGVMTMGRIGKAVCRLMDTRRMLEVEIGALCANPAAVLCDNPACADCAMQRGKIKAARLAQEDFTLAAVAGDISVNAEVVLKSIQAEGISALELKADEYPRYAELIAQEGVTITAILGELRDTAGLKLAQKLGVPLIVPVRNREELEMIDDIDRGQCKMLIENDGAPSGVFTKAYTDMPNLPPLSFNPREFAAVKQRPFLEVFYRGILRKNVAHFYIDDGTFDGHATLPGRGNGEVKEIISMLRCRGYDGVMTLRSHDRGPDAFREAAERFWTMLDTM